MALRSDSHDTQPHPPRQRRSRPTRSSSKSQRSPSPIVGFATTSLTSATSPSATSPVHSSSRATSPSISPEHSTGVKHITRKVIKRLEGLGHLEMDENDRQGDTSAPLTEEDEGEEVERVLRANGVTTNGNGVNGHAKPTKPKTDYEIPRKALHSSIGFFTLYLYYSSGDVRTIVSTLWLALAVIVPADLLRFSSPRFERTYERFLGFLMRESEKDSVNGVVWYILGVNFVLTFLPQDIATVAILILSWADTAASTFGRLLGSYTPRLPARIPILRLPLAPRKSLAGFIAACLTGAAIAWGFWGWVAPVRNGGREVTWNWEDGVRAGNSDGGMTGIGGGGALGLAAISVVAGLVSGVAEALDLGSMDDNLTLPVISGLCLSGFFKAFGAALTWFGGSMPGVSL